MSAPHPQRPPMSVAHWVTQSTTFTAGDVLVGVDEDACIVIWFPKDVTEFTVTNLDQLIRALQTARIDQLILSGERSDVDVDHFCKHCGRGIDLTGGEVFTSLNDNGTEVGVEECPAHPGGHEPDPDQTRGPHRAWEAMRLAETSDL